MNTETITKSQWALDVAHSELRFKIKHLMISNVTGHFTKFDVTAESDDNDFTTANISASIDVASISTNNESRDQHLRTGDFFEAEKFPLISFVSKNIVKTAEETFVMQGEITMKGITKPVTLDVEHTGVIKDLYGNTKAGFSVMGKLNRKDWGINFNAALETGGVMLGEEVKLMGEIQLVKQAEV